MATIPKGFASSLRPDSSGRGSKRLNTWQSVRTEVLNRIRSGEWSPGQMIPTEQELSVELGCARATVNRALRELAESGVVERRRKVGTRIAARPARKTTLDMPLIREEIEATGATYRYVLESYSLSHPSDAAQRALQVDREDELILIRAQYLANEKPHCCEAIWLNPQHLPPFPEHEAQTQPAHEWLARNVPLTRGRFAILAEAASGECARNLDIPEGTPVLTIERLSWRDATPVAFARQFYPPKHRLVSED
jgi:GntR family histidine utilization transcriptional repressor